MTNLPTIPADHHQQRQSRLGLWLRRGLGRRVDRCAGSPYQAGVKPSALATDPTNRFVYVTDFASNELIGYTVQSGSALNFMINGPFKTGNEPSAVAIDPRGIYIYVANSLDSTVSAYAIALPTGTPSAVVNATGSAATPPTPSRGDRRRSALGRFVYTANYLGNSVSGFRLNPNTGALDGHAGHALPNRSKSNRAGIAFLTATTRAVVNPVRPPVQREPSHG